MKSPLPRSIARRLPASLSSDSADSAGLHDGGSSGGGAAGNKENGGVGSIIGIGTSSRAKTATRRIDTRVHTRTSNGEQEAQAGARQQRALASEVAFLRQELSAIVEKHSMDKLAARKMEGAYQERIGQIAEELREVRDRLEAKDGTLRVLEKQLRGKNTFVDELRGRIEDLLRERKELHVEEANDAAAAASASASESSTSISSGSNTSTFCPTPSFASSPVPAVPPAGRMSTGTVTPTRQTMRRSSGVGAGSIVRSALRTPDVATVANDASVSAPMTPPPPFRSPSPTSRSVAPRSLQHHYAPQTRTSTNAATAQRDPSEGGIETPLTPSTRANFLLMEQKKTIESLTRALIAKTDECATMEREFEQYKMVVAQETKGAYFLSRKDMSLVTKGPVNAESVLCDSDEFDMERSCSGHDGDARDDASTRSTAASSAKKNGNGKNESAASDHFLNRLDNIGLDLSMDIADLSALIDDPDAPMRVGAANNGGI